MNKKVARLVCECPAKCSLYENLFTELVAEANNRLSNFNQQELNNQHYSVNQKFDKSNDEFYSSGKSILINKFLLIFICMIHWLELIRVFSLNVLVILVKWFNTFLVVLKI